MPETTVPALRFLDEKPRKGRARPLTIDSAESLLADLRVDGPAIFAVPNSSVGALGALAEVVAYFPGDATSHWPRLLGFLVKERQRRASVKAVLYKLELGKAASFDVTVDKVFAKAATVDPGAIVIFAIAFERLTEIAERHGAKLGRALKPQDLDVLVGDGEVPAGIADAFPGASGYADAVRRLAVNATRSPTLLLLGPPGSGKRVLARAVANAATSSKQAVPREELDCASFSDDRDMAAALFGSTDGTVASLGAWDRARDGTLLLIQVDELSLPLQRQLATAIREGSFRRSGSPEMVQTPGVGRPRVIATTARRLDDLREGKVFDATLAHTLLSLHIRVPSLVERGDDFDQIADAVWRRIDAKAPLLSDGVRRALKRHIWQGNLRELKSLLTSVWRRFGPTPEPGPVQRSIEDLQTVPGGGWGLIAALPSPSECARVLKDVRGVLSELDDRLAVLEAGPAPGGVAAAEKRAVSVVPAVEPLIQKLGDLVVQPFWFGDQSTWRAAHAAERLVAPFPDISAREVVKRWTKEHNGAPLRQALRKVRVTLDLIATLD